MRVRCACAGLGFVFIRLLGDALASAFRVGRFLSRWCVFLLLTAERGVGPGGGVSLHAGRGRSSSACMPNLAQSPPVCAAAWAGRSHAFKPHSISCRFLSESKLNFEPATVAIRAGGTLSRLRRSIHWFLRPACCPREKSTTRLLPGPRHVLSGQPMVSLTMSSMRASRPTAAHVAVAPAVAKLASFGAARHVEDVSRAGVAALRADPAERALTRGPRRFPYVMLKFVRAPRARKSAF